MELLMPVLSRFQLDGVVRKVTNLRIGHINQSYKVRTARSAYFVQQINETAFQDVDGLMQNIELVTNHLQKELSEGPYETLRVIKTLEDRNYLRHDGGAWRIFDYKEDLVSYDNPVGLAQLGEGAKAYASFLVNLRNLNPKELSITIPRFHSLRFRIEQLNEACRSCPEEKLEEAMPLLQFITTASTILLELETAWEKGQIPTRITHNDTKFNNVLFNKEGKARCVVDLDTVMPGVLHFDIGDGLRSISSLSPEDEPNPDRIHVDQQRYETFIGGFQEVLADEITEEERKFIPYAGPYMAMIMGVRMLTDYLLGNKYYPVDYPEHNLVRATSQLRLTERMMALM